VWAERDSTVTKAGWKYSMRDSNATGVSQRCGREFVNVNKPERVLGTFRNMGIFVSVVDAQIIRWSSSVKEHWRILK
jgi:hypothetical protein